MAQAARDQNRVPTALGVSSIDFATPTTAAVNPSTHGWIVEATFSASAIAISDGVDANIKATVFDYTNSNPLAVVLRDTNGDYVAVGGGTQYATNVAYADGNVGNIALTVRDDALTTLTEADGDFSTLRVTSVGRLWASVVVDTALPAGTNNIGDVDIVSGTITTVSTVTSLSQFAGQAIALNAGAVSAGTLRVVDANGAGKTILSAGGSASSSGNNTIVAAGTARLKVFAFTLSTLSTASVICIFQSGAGGTELWRVVLQAPTGVGTGANLAVTPPAWLFATASATLLNLNLSSANAVNWSVSYYDEA